MIVLNSWRYETILRMVRFGGSTSWRPPQKYDFERFIIKSNFPSFPFSKPCVFVETSSNLKKVITGNSGLFKNDSFKVLEV